MRSWEIKERFVADANKILRILEGNTLKSAENILSLEELVESANKDPLFGFSLQLLEEEYSCRSHHHNFKLIDFNRNSDLIGIETWFIKVISGLISDEYPTIEYLLKKQGRPSIYSELNEIFGATKLLNRFFHTFDVNLSQNENEVNLLNNPKDSEIFYNLPTSIKSAVESNFLLLQLPKESKTKFVDSPSFRFELLNYISFDAKTEFKSIPQQFLEMTDGSDAGAPFARRWARRIAAKSSAWDKINFNPQSFGRFPTPISKLPEIALNFQVTFPESLSAELVHQNIFEISTLTPEFIEWTTFSVHLAQFLKEVPSVLTANKLRNIEIFSHAPTTAMKGPNSTLSYFKALLLATGIRGHLTPEALPPVDIHDILNFDSEGTSACLLLGLSLSYLKNQNPSHSHSRSRDQISFLHRLFSMHLSTSELEIPCILQLSSALSLGFIKFRSCDRGTSQLLLKEIYRKLPQNVNCKAADTPLLSHVSAMALGMCLMGLAVSPDQNEKLFIYDIQNQLSSQINGKLQYQISALMADAFININNAEFDYKSLPWARTLPDLLNKPEQLVYWTILTWRLSQWSNTTDFKGLQDQGYDEVILNFDAIFDSVCNPNENSIWTDSSQLGLFVYACQILSANAFYLALRYAGAKCPKSFFDNLNCWLLKLKNYSILRNSDCDYFLTKIQTHLLTTFQFLLLAKCILLAGSGDLECWRLLRELSADPLLFKYGNSRLFYSAIGFLFLNSGQSTVSTSSYKNGKEEINFVAITGLLLSFSSFLPTCPTDGEFSFLSLLDPLWTLSVTN